jgi:hypothetical protein
MKPYIQETISTTAGLATIVGLSIFQSPIILSAVAGIGIYVGCKLLLDEGSTKLSISYKTSDKIIQEAIDKALSSLQKIKDQTQFIQKKDVKQKVIEITNFGLKVIEVLSDEVNAVTVLGDVNKILNQFEILLKKYIDLINHTVVKYGKQDVAIENFEAILVEVDKSLQNLYKLGIKSDVASFEVEMKLIDQKIKSISELE